MITASEPRVFCVPCMAKGFPIILFERAGNVVFIRIHKRQWSVEGGVVGTQCPNCSHPVSITLDRGAEKV